MIQWMVVLVLIGFFFSLIPRGSIDGKMTMVGLVSRWIQWIGWLWITVFGAMFVNEVLRSIGAPHTTVFQSGSWQPLGPILLGIMLLNLWYRRQKNSGTK